MVLKLKNLKSNVEQYIRMAKIVRGILELMGVPDENYERTMAVAEENLKELKRLLADGVTVLQVPQRR